MTKILGINENGELAITEVRPNGEQFETALRANDLDGLRSLLAFHGDVDFFSSSIDFAEDYTEDSVVLALVRELQDARRDPYSIEPESGELRLAPGTKVRNRRTGDLGHIVGFAAIQGYGIDAPLYHVHYEKLGKLRRVTVKQTDKKFAIQEEEA